MKWIVIRYNRKTNLAMAYPEPFETIQDAMDFMTKIKSELSAELKKITVLSFTGIAEPGDRLEKYYDDDDDDY